MHFPGGTVGCVGMEIIRLSMLSKRSRFGTERSQTERAESGKAGETRVRGNVHDRGQGLGGRADIGTNYNWKNFGKGRFLIDSLEFTRNSSGLNTKQLNNN